MKKYFLLALVVLTGIASSCKYNDDEVWDSVNNLADRVTSLEAVTKQMNSDISAMQNIIAALQNKVSVSEVEKLADGYIIHFSDGTKATIKNGTDGKDGANGSDGKDGADGQDGKDGKDGKDGLNAPVINVAKDKGVYYWTITVDGKTEWLTDDKGNKLAVAGKDGFDGTDGEDGVDGKDGNTPLLKVSSDGYWMVSYDEGEEYEYVKDVYGYKVKAEGSNGAAGDSKFKEIKRNDAGDMVIITLSNGTSYEIPLAPAVTYSGEGYSNGVVSMIKETVELTYTVSQMSNPSVEVIKEEGVSVTVDESNKTLKIKFVQGTTVTEGKVVILYYNSNQTITSVLTVMAVNKNTGIPYDGQAGNTPSVTGNTFLPTGISAMSVDPNNANVGRFSMAGIRPNDNGNWLKLYGTGHSNQNVWLEINGVQKSVQVTNGDDLAPAPVSRSTSVAKAKADIVFLVDNSASMEAEAENVKRDILEWAKSLSEVMDVQFGCVGQSIWGINGALNITTADKLNDYLSIDKPAGGADTYYTRHFGETMKNPPSDRKLLEQKADEYGTVNTKINNTSEEYGECGGIMLHFADENFDFRDGANRFYVYITDEANQPNYNKNNMSGQWSVESVNPASEYYNWGANKGIIYTVMTGEKSFTEEEPLYKEDPTKFSEYTGGIALKQSGKTFNLFQLPITDAVKKSYIFSFNLPEDMEDENEVVITIKDGNHESKYTYVGVAFVENN